MRERFTRRKHSSTYSLKRILFFFFLIFAMGLILGTVFYSVPTVYDYLSKKGYISPLASTFHMNDALGNSITQDLVKRELQKSNFSIKSIEEYDDSYEVILKSQEKVLFSKKKDISEQISSLQLISSRLTIEGKHFKSLDLRFDRPVLVPK